MKKYKAGQGQRKCKENESMKQICRFLTLLESFFFFLHLVNITNIFVSHMFSLMAHCSLDISCFSRKAMKLCLSNYINLLKNLIAS